MEALKLNGPAVQEDLRQLLRMSREDRQAATDILRNALDGKGGRRSLGKGGLQAHYRVAGLDELRAELDALRAENTKTAECKGGSGRLEAVAGAERLIATGAWLGSGRAALEAVDAELRQLEELSSH
mmetsp:Transcript_8773/g.36475  ORF Transcript_8773/g.36475 Transcript_8773/m.36475 type:complete len:127 (+) Transcript_8773:71-451(+)